MEFDLRDHEPCLSPAAFVNQVQYSNILEGRFKQLQGKRRAVARFPRGGEGSGGDGVRGEGLTPILLPLQPGVKKEREAYSS